MGFKENLLNKIEIDELAATVAASVGPQVDGAKFDKSAARHLIEKGDFPHVELKDRNLELYILEEHDDKKKMIVLDNGLAIYDTTIDDVALRKSPTIKEMISIRNTRKILSDSDVLMSKRADSVRAIKQMLIAELDLTYTDSDIDAIAQEGAVCLEDHDSGCVKQSLTLFGEILGFEYAPKMFQVAHCEIRGDLKKDTAGKVRFGPAYVYDQARNDIKFIASTLDSSVEDDLNRYRQILKGDLHADAEGTDVFRRLKQLVMERKPDLSAASGLSAT